MSISSDEINFLIYRYLQENGFSHSAFTFAHESLVIRSTVAQAEVPAGALITFLQKGLEYVGIEEHINEDGSIREFDGEYSLLSPFICEAIGIKEERRYKKLNPGPPGASEASAASAVAESGDGSGAASSGSADAMDVSGDNKEVNGDIIVDSGFKSVELRCHEGREVFNCAWNPVRAQLASGSSDGTSRLWDFESLNWSAPDANVSVMSAVLPHYKTEGESFKDITAMQWSPDGQVLATGCFDGSVRLWNQDGTLLSSLAKHEGPVFAVRWSKNGNLLLTGGSDRIVNVWDTATFSLIKMHSLHAAQVVDVDWSDSDMFASCSSDRIIHVCKVSLPGSGALTSFVGHSNEINMIKWSPNGQLLASASDDGTAKIWSVEQGLVHDLKGHLREVFCLAWASSSALCTASFDGTAKVWNVLTGDLVFSFKRSMQPCYCLAVNPEGTLLAVGSLKGYVTLWNLKSGAMVREIKEQGDTFHVSWSTDGKMLSSCFSKGLIHVMLVDDISV